MLYARKIHDTSVPNDSNYLMHCFISYWMWTKIIKCATFAKLIILGNVYDIIGDVLSLTVKTAAMIEPINSFYI